MPRVLWVFECPKGDLQRWQREELWVLECPRGFAGVATGGVVGA